MIGDAQVKDLLQNLPEHVQQKIQRTTCQLTFRFGNQQTLTSRHALLLPLGRAKFRIAVVPGRTPFLLSSSFLKGIQAVIGTDQGTMWSKTLNRELVITQSQKNLFLMDISQLWPTTSELQQVQKSDAVGFTCQPVPIQNVAEAVWETQHDMSNMYKNMDAQHDNMSHGQEQYLNHARNDQGKAGDGDSESASCWKGLIKSQPDLVMPVFSNQDRDSLCIDPSTRPSHTHHVLGVNRVSEAASAPRISEEDGQSSRDRKDSIHVAGTARSGEDLVWKVQTRSEVRGGLQGRILDGLVCDDLREESKTSAPDVCPVRGQTIRSGNDEGVQSRVSELFQETGKVGGTSQSLCRSVSGVGCLGSSLRSRSMPGVRDAQLHQTATGRGTNALPEHGEQESRFTDHQHRDENAGALPSHASTKCEERIVGSEWI